MAKMLEGQSAWSAKIRCAHPVCVGGLYRVDGCFGIIEISLDDIHGQKDSEGDWRFWVECPACKQVLYPQWQIGRGPLDAVVKRVQKGGKQ